MLSCKTSLAKPLLENLSWKKSLRKRGIKKEGSPLRFRLGGGGSEAELRSRVSPQSIRTRGDVRRGPEALYAHWQ